MAKTEGVKRERKAARRGEGAAARKGGPPITSIGRPGTFAFAIYDVREQAGIGRSEMADRITADTELDFHAFASNITFWEGDLRPITEKVAVRYGRQVGLEPVLLFVSAEEKAKIVAGQVQRLRKRLKDAGVPAETIRAIIQGKPVSHR